MSERPDISRAVGDWLSRLSLPVLAAFGGVILAGVAGGGYYAYQTYDYVQHDNDFCMSCHLMAEPYEQFARSAHRGLGCKACHQPTLIARSQMALSQIVENPQEIDVHAEVPNRTCAECHIDGDPEKWRLIANSVGHKVHLESDDPALGGLQCVECHSSSVHEFAPIDRTCAQSSCHEDKTIQLGGMSDLTIHCAACHTFVAPVSSEIEGQAALDAAILPDQEECFSCHVMRTLVSMPRPDPHRGVCASCHNPHEQATPAEAVQSCTASDCHARADTVTPMHRNLPPTVLEGCLGCHQAHDFALDGAACLNCHEGIQDDDLSLPVRAEGVAPGAVSMSTGAEAARGASPFEHVLGVGEAWWGHESAPMQERPKFLHSQHRDVGCGNCHDSSSSHGGLVVATLQDCRSCHHTEPVARSCERCHDESDQPTRTFQAPRAMDLSVGRVARRVLPFEHAPHEGLDCASCHTQGLDRSAAQADCAGCHEDHHHPDNSCVACHEAAPTSAHPVSEIHVTCSGASCHQDVPFETVPRTRQVCEVCHQDMQDHRPDRACIQCHALPDPRSQEDGP